MSIRVAHRVDEETPALAPVHRVRRRAARSRRGGVPGVPGRTAGPPPGGVHAERHRAGDAHFRKARSAAHEERGAAHHVDSRRRARHRGQLPRQSIRQGQLRHRAQARPAVAVGECRGPGESVREVREREGGAARDFRLARVRRPANRARAGAELARRPRPRLRDADAQSHRSVPGRRRRDPQRQHRGRQRADRLRMARRSSHACEQGAGAARRQRAVEDLPGAACDVDAAVASGAHGVARAGSRAAHGARYRAQRRWRSASREPGSDCRRRVLCQRQGNHGDRSGAQSTGRVRCRRR